ncbi:hypothetical protein GQR58_029822 [Nymphon striatum]|nr:hypothetical protein GQR58_029822 [Nymphon striatum]
MVRCRGYRSRRHLHDDERQAGEFLVRGPPGRGRREGPGLSQPLDAHPGTPRAIRHRSPWPHAQGNWRAGRKQLRIGDRPVVSIDDVERLLVQFVSYLSGEHRIVEGPHGLLQSVVTKDVEYRVVRSGRCECVLEAALVANGARHWARRRLYGQEVFSEQCGPAGLCCFMRLGVRGEVVRIDLTYQSKLRMPATGQAIHEITRLVGLRLEEVLLQQRFQCSASPSDKRRVVHGGGIGFIDS